MTLPSALPAASPEQAVPSTGNGPVGRPATETVSNGAALPKASRLPRARRKNRTGWYILAAVLFVVVFAAAGIWYVWFRGPQVRVDLVTAKVEYKDLQLKIVERGGLEAKDNHDIKCEVKTGNRGAPKIKWVVENGTYVKEGDLLVDIDSSYLEDQAQTQKIARDNAENDKIKAEQDYPSLKIAITVAEQNLKKWIEGDFPQSLHDLEGQIQTAESNLLQEEDRAAWVARMVKKGYMTASQEASEEALLTGNKLSLQKVQEQKAVLTKYTDPVNRLTYETAITTAKNAEHTGHANMESKKAVFLQQDEQYKDLLDQIKQCKVYAPNAGIVVYAVPEQTRMGAGATQSIIAQGEPVQYGQKMMSIPDLSHMLVNVRIHEAFINNMRKDLPATVRVDALGNKILKAYVKSVANVASAQDWMSPDVKVYQAYVEIDESVEALKLKPGLSAVCTIFTETKAEHVLAIPVEAIMSPLEKGGKPRCYVETASGVEQRFIDIGMTDEKFVEIKDGVSEGENVILNPRALLSDKEKKGAKEEEKIVPTGNKPGGPGRGGPGGGARGGDPKGNPGGPGGSSKPPAERK
jgi:HlyD family secretion protein